MSRAVAAPVGAAVASGALLAAARPPLDLGPLALVALVPLLWVWRDRRPRAAAGIALVAGCTYYGILVSWAWYFGAVAIVPFVMALGLYWAAVGAGVAAFSRVGLRSPWLTAGVWVLGEALVSRWPVGGFSWGEVGYALHDVPAARSVAALGGLPLVSFGVVLLNGLIVDVVRAGRPRLRRATVRPAATCLAVAVAVVPVHLGRVEPRGVGALRYALVQGNDLNRDLTPAERDARYLPQSHFDLAARLDDRYDLVVFPESSMDADPRFDEWLEQNLTRVARRLHTAVLANAIADAPDGRALNLNLLYDPDGRLQGTYAKRHLVPYGEWVPFRRYLRWVRELEQIPRDFAPGRDPAIFDVAGQKVATVICFESAFGPQIRGVVADGAQVIVVSTNNRSYRRSGNSAQHVAISQMRAAETGRPVIHASISGITAVIDAKGDIVSTTRLFEPTVVTGVLTATTGRTPYVRFGEWVVLVTLFAVGACALAGLARRRRRSIDFTRSAGERTAAAPGAAPREPTPEHA